MSSSRDCPAPILLAAHHNGRRVTCEISGPVTLVGSRRDCALALTHPDISKVHCAIVATGGAWFVADLCSRTGTFVNETAIRAARLLPGQRLRVGPIEIEVRFAPGAPPGETTQPMEFEQRFAAPLVLSNAQHHIELPSFPALIGRRSTSHVPLDSPDVSLVHALLFAIDGEPVVFDLGSRIGTFVNKKRIEMAWLHHGDRVRFGDVDLAVAWEASPHVQPAEESDAGHRRETPQVAPSPGCEAGPVRDADAPILARPAAVRPRVRCDDSADAGQSLEFDVAVTRPDSATSETPATVGTDGLDQHFGELEKALARIRAALGAQSLDLQNRASALLQKQVALDARAAELAQAQERVCEHLADLEKREARLGCAEADLALRLAELEAREQALAEAQKRIDQFKAAFESAAACVSSAPRAAAAQPASSAAPPAVMPAPVVGKPLFAADEPARRDRTRH